MKLLGIDYGSKNIGLALSDEDSKIAFPYGVVYNKSGVLDEIISVVRKEKISKIILGLPVPFAGRENKQTQEVRDFAKKLEQKIKLPVEFQNEILTTKSAKAGSTKETIDSSAAAIILQSYLDKKATSH
ncbi:MAG: Holliday junction resolvase RuvX [bacterium]|nr:Holliday junction resolvase RuvX [bacterium]